MTLLSRSTQAFLEAHGGAAALSSPQGVDGIALACMLRKAFPSDSSWTEENRAYLAVLTELLGRMDERLYHFYRPVADLFLETVFRLGPGADRGDPVWKGAMALGTDIGLLEPSEIDRQPHLFASGGTK